MLNVLLIVWFGSRFLLTSGLEDAERSQVIAWNLVEGGLLAVCFVAFLGWKSRATRMFVIRTKEDRQMLGLLGAWFVVSLVSATVGLTRDYDLNFLVGDYYKFVALSFVLALFYFSLPTEATVRTIIRGFVLVYAASLTFDIIWFKGFVFSGVRLTTETAGHTSLMAPMVVYLMLAEKKRFLRVGASLLLLEMLGAMIAAQTLRPFICVIMSIVLFLLPTRKASLVMALTLGLGAFLVAVFYTDAVLSTSSTYLNDKIELAMLAPSPSEALEDLSGARLGEVRFVIHEMTSKPELIPFGAGLGSMNEPESIQVGFLPSYAVYKHYFHSGLFEVLYRSGVIGLAIFLLVFIHLFLRAYHLYAHGGELFGLFAMVGLTTTLLALSYDAPLASPLPLLAIWFAGISVKEATGASRVGQASSRRATVSLAGRQLAAGPGGAHAS